jgi:hypothetical protein
MSMRLKTTCFNVLKIDEQLPMFQLDAMNPTKEVFDGDLSQTTANIYVFGLDLTKTVL